MSNHTIDCRFCGADQRIHTDHCCAESRKATEDATKARRERERQVDERLAAHGIVNHTINVHDGEKVLAALDAARSEYRPGLPSVEQKRAHEARGGWWMIQESHLAPRIMRADNRAYFGFVSQSCRSRPCLPDGTLCPWPVAP